MNIRSPSQFDVKSTGDDLLLNWTKLKASLQDWRWVSRAASWASGNGIDAEAYNEGFHAIFRDEFVADGWNFSDADDQSFRRAIAKLRQSGFTGELPPLHEQRKKKHVRVEQYENLPEALKVGLDDLILYNSANSEATKARKRRQILRAIDLAQQGGAVVFQLNDLWDIPTIMILENAGWGSSHEPWQGDPNAVEFLHAVLSMGMHYCFGVLKDIERGSFLRRLIKRAPKRQSGINGADYAATLELDHNDLAAIVTASTSIVDNFLENPTVSGGFKNAQLSVALWLLLSTARRPCWISQITFTGPTRQIGPGEVRGTLRYPDSPDFDIEGEWREATIQRLDGFYRVSGKILGRPLVGLMELPGGGLRSPSDFPNWVRIFGEELGLKISPRILGLLVVRLLMPKEDQSDNELERIARILGISQIINLKSRYGVFMKSGASQQHADGVLTGDNSNG